MALLRSWLNKILKKFLRIRFVGVVVLIFSFLVALVFLPFYILILLFSSGWPKKLSSDEARVILREEIGKLRGQEYQELLRYLDEECFQRTGKSGTVYNVSVNAFPERPDSGGDIRVIVKVDDGTWGALCSAFALSDEFVVSRD